jgi:membrane associated rhomboid family serine protease
VKLIKQKKEERDMRTREMVKTGMVGALMALVATPAFARTVEFKEAGAALWVFVAIGAVIILLQLIPAAILFFSFIGTTVSMGLKKEKKAEEEVMAPEMEPVPVKK